MNMLLHGIATGDVLNDDTLAEPRHVQGGELMRFDRVLSNPPFAQNYVKKGIKYPERFRFGWCPEGGKKADLMFVQHMLAVLRPKGMAITVMPHGVLFRGGEEKNIRTKLLDEDLLDAVIGLGPNLFYGTGIPACLLVLRAPGAKPKNRRGKVLFINADREYAEGRAQNYVLPEHAEKIYACWAAFEDVDGFARVVSRAELRDNDDNLNIRRYADNAPPPEPQDVRAHLLGGIPKAEVEAKAGLFAAHGLEPMALLVPRKGRPSGYLEFAKGIDDKVELGRRIAADAGVLAKEQALADAVARWWKKHGKLLHGLAEPSAELMKVRADLLASFAKAVAPIGLLDRFEVAGVIATWWGEVQYDLRTIVAQGFAGLVEGWETSIRSALDDKKRKDDPLEHRLVKRLLPEYLAELAELETKVAELDGTIKGASGGGDDEDSDDEGESEEQLSEAELKALKSELKASKKLLKGKREAFVQRLTAARAELSKDQARTLVLEILRGDLDEIIGRYVAAHRRAVVAAFEAWWEKYRVTLTSIEAERDQAAELLRGFLGGLGYV